MSWGSSRRFGKQASAANGHAPPSVESPPLRGKERGCGKGRQGEITDDVLDGCAYVIGPVFFEGCLPYIVLAVLLAVAVGLVWTGLWPLAILGLIAFVIWWLFQRAVDR